MVPTFHPRYLTKIKESNTRPTVQGLLNQSSLARQTAAWNHCQPLSKCIGVWVLEYQRACPQENHPDVAGLRWIPCSPSLRSAFLSFFVTLTSSILSPLLLLLCLYFVLLSFDLPSTFSTCILSLSFVPKKLFLPFSVFFTPCPLKPKRPPVLWDLISL